MTFNTSASSQTIQKIQKFSRDLFFLRLSKESYNFCWYIQFSEKNYIFKKLIATFFEEFSWVYLNFVISLSHPSFYFIPVDKIDGIKLRHKLYMLNYSFKLEYRCLKVNCNISTAFILFILTHHKNLRRNVSLIIYNV